MGQNTVVVGILLLIVGLGIGYAVWGNNPTTLIDTHMMGDGSMMSQNIDQHFIAQMIPHHEGAIAMAKIALERSKRPEMLSLANDIIKAQQKEINDMRGWYETWYGSVPPEDGAMGSMTGEPDTLRSVGPAEFDREFIVEMIPHHEMAIMMAQMLAAATERPEMKQLADNIITSQSREIDMMRNWLEDWYR